MKNNKLIKILIAIFLIAILTFGIVFIIENTRKSKFYVKSDLALGASYYKDFQLLPLTTEGRSDEHYEQDALEALEEKTITIKHHYIKKCEVTYKKPDIHSAINHAVFDLDQYQYPIRHSYENDEISVDIDDKGNILSYYNKNCKKEDKGLGEKEIKEIADKCLNKLTALLYSKDYEFKRIQNNGETHIVYYQLTVKGYDTPQQIIIYVGLDGSICGFDLNEYYDYCQLQKTLLLVTKKRLKNIEDELREAMEVEGIEFDSVKDIELKIDNYGSPYFQLRCNYDKNTSIWFFAKIK